MPVQYVTWLGRALHGDLGRSLELHEPVLQLVAARFVNTLILVTSAMLVAAVIGIVAGTLAALHAHTAIDRTLMLLALTANSTPSFWLGLALILVFSLGLRLLPSSGMVSARGDGGPLDLAAAPDLAIGDVGGDFGGLDRAHDSRVIAGSADAGVRARRARQGFARKRAGAATRAEKRLAARAHRDGFADGRAAGWGRDHRDDL